MEKTVIRKPKLPAEQKQTSKMLDWLLTRGISEQTAQKFRLFEGQETFGNGSVPCISFPYIADGEIVNVKYRAYDKQFKQTKDAQRTLYNIDSITGDTAVFVEGEMDVLACYEAGIKNAISLPDGAPKEAKFNETDKRFAALAECAKLEGLNKIIIAVDADEAGRALAAELAHRFGKDRCFKVKWPDNNDVQCKDANECLLDHGKVVVTECIQLAEPYPIDGLYKAKDYFSQVWDLYEGKQAKPFSTGFPLLDSIYKLMPSTFNVVTGIPNHGKSNFMDQLMVNAAKMHGWKFGIFSPEHSTTYHIRRLAELRCRKPFDEGPTQRISQSELRDAISWIEEHFVFIESRERVPNIKWLLEKARAACVRHGINGLLVDPYNEIDASRTAGKREDEHIRDMISSCKQFCRSHNIIMWVVAHPAKLARQNDGTYPVPSMYDISGSAHWHNMADVGLVVHRLFDEDQVIVCTKKIREQGWYGNIGEAIFRYDTAAKSYQEYNPDVSATRPYWQDD
jgi:twinkle protein